MTTPSPRLSESDPEISDLIRQESQRQRSQINLVASENLVTPAVLEALGSILTNKYAEGIPGRRWYGGCEVVDRIETVAIERAKALFGADHANVQPHSGSSANLAAYLALIKPGDSVMAMRLDQGGHLTHGSPVNFSGQWYKIVPYGVDPRTLLIDYTQLRELALRERPKLIVAGGSAYPRHIDFGPFKEIAGEIDAKLMVDMAHFAGLVAAGLHPNPAPVADVVTSSTHKTLRGPRGGMVLCRKEWTTKLNAAVFPGVQGGPLEHVIAAKAVAFKEAADPAFTAYQTQVVENARAMARTLMEEGFQITTGGTDTHLLVVDLRSTELTGKVADKILGEAGIVVNKNAVPFDPRPPMESSGIRLGTPSITTRGMKAKEAGQIARWISAILKNPTDSGLREKTRQQAHELLEAFPPPA